MRTIEEIKAEIEKTSEKISWALQKDYAINTRGNLQKLERLKSEYFTRVTEGVPLSRLEEICNAERDGRCVVLPCKVGDVIYEANVIRNIVSVYKVTSVVIMTSSRNYGWELISGIYSNVNGFNEFALGKTVFLTREAAEATLKGATTCDQ